MMLFLTFSESIVSICNRLKFIINTVSLSLTKTYLYTDDKIIVLVQHYYFLVCSCWAIWRVINCSPLTLQRCFINTEEHLISLLSKTLPNICSYCSIRSFISPSHLKVLLSTNTCLPHFFQSHLNSAVSGEMLQVAFTYIIF